MLIVFALLASSLSTTSDLSMYIKTARSYCVNEILSVSQVASGSYSCALNTSYPLTFYVSPTHDRRVVVYTSNKEAEIFAFNVPSSGAYKFCFELNFSYSPPPGTDADNRQTWRGNQNDIFADCHISLAVEEEQKERPSDRLEATLSTVSEEMSEIQASQRLARLRERRLSSSVSSIITELWICFVLEVGLLLIAVVGQSIYIKSIKSK